MENNEKITKTKLGISAGLFGAALYFVGLMSIIPLVVMAGYVLLCEENEWLKKAAVKAVAIVLFFTVISTLISLVGNSETLLEQLAGLFRTSLEIPFLYRIMAICRTAIALAQAALLLLLGLKALKQETIKIGPIDTIIAKHM
jgi:hypothetical protein